MWIRTNEDFISGEWPCFKSNKIQTPIKFNALKWSTYVLVRFSHDECDIDFTSLKLFFLSFLLFSLLILKGVAVLNGQKMHKIQKIYRTYPKCITWFKNISDISDYWDFHCVPEEKWISHISDSSPTILAKGPPRPGQAGPDRAPPVPP